MSAQWSVIIEERASDEPDAPPHWQVIGPFATHLRALEFWTQLKYTRNKAGLGPSEVRIRVAPLINRNAFQYVPHTQRPDAQVLAGPGLARSTDPQTSRDAALLINAKATTARVQLLKVHVENPRGLTDEEAATLAGLSLLSEYSTRCSELKRMGVLLDSGTTREGQTGVHRLVRMVSDYGVKIWEARGEA